MLWHRWILLLCHHVKQHNVCLGPEERTTVSRCLSQRRSWLPMNWSRIRINTHYILSIHQWKQNSQFFKEKIMISNYSAKCAQNCLFIMSSPIPGARRKKETPITGKEKKKHTETQRKTSSFIPALTWPHHQQPTSLMPKKQTDARARISILWRYKDYPEAEMLISKRLIILVDAFHAFSLSSGGGAHHHSALFTHGQ